MLTMEQQERALKLRRVGNSYRAIAEKLGDVSHETVRTALTAMVESDDPALTPVTSTNKNRRIREISEWVEKNGPVQRSAVMAAFDLTTEQLASIMGALPEHLIVYDGKHRAHSYTDADITDAIQRAWSALQTENPHAKGLSHAFYEKVREMSDPSSARILARRSSWALACEDAGVPSGDRNRPLDSYTSKWDDDDILGIVAKFVAYCGEQEVRPTYARYDAWQRLSPDRPSGSLVRTRLYAAGIPGWSEITMAAINRGR